jgi:hypothetical protein
MTVKSTACESQWMPWRAFAKLLENRVVAKAQVEHASADFTIYFDDGTVLQIVNLSSGYEAWTLDSEGDFIVGGRNGST